MRSDHATATRQAIVTAIVCATAALAVACGGDHPTSPSTTVKNVNAVNVASTSTSATTFQLTATAMLTDGSSRDVTAMASWRSSNPALATVNGSGQVNVAGTGEVDISATYQDVTGNAHLVVTRVPVSSVNVTGGPSPSSTTFQLNAMARLADGSAQDVTRSATWESSNNQIATVTSGGTVTIVGSGEVDIRATYQGVSGSTHATVSLAVKYTVAGVVMDTSAASGKRVEGARVQIVLGDHAMTDAQGAFSIAGVPSGKAIIEVTKDGYQMYSNQITVDRDLQLAITLTPTTTQQP